MNATRLAAVGAAVVAAGAAAFALLRRGEDAPPGTPPPPAAGPAAKSPTVGFVVGSPVDGRWGPDPCCGIPGGGLYSLPALRDELKTRVPLTVSCFLGDVGPGPGELGRLSASYVWPEIVDDLDFPFSAAGPLDLALGAEFARAVLARLPRTAVMCANAVAPEGGPLLRGWAIADAGGTAVICVAVVAESLGDELAASGSDVRLRPAGDAAVEALAAAEDAARRQDRRVSHRILLVHGTLDETAAIVPRLPGLTFAVAARGDVLPDAEPRDVGGVPVFRPGRGLRFGHRMVSVEGGRLESALVRLGVELYAAGSPISGPLGGLHDFVADVGVRNLIAPEDRRPADPRGEYVGAARCAPCHAEQVAAHDTSPHRRAGTRLQNRLYRANTQCLGCHATAPFHRGGWRGPDDASDLAGVSCEVCHGPGSRHVEDPKAGWGAVAFDRCRSCHLPERTPLFDPEATWRARGHGGH